MSWRYIAAATLMFWTMLGGAAFAKIEQFRDTQGTLHITNAGEDTKAKPKTGLQMPQAQPPESFPQPVGSLPEPPPVPEVPVPEAPEQAQEAEAPPPEAEVPPEEEPPPGE